MANGLGQPTAQEIAEKFCTEMLCNALLCDGCPVQAIQRAAQHRVQADLGWKCAVCESTNLASDLECGYCDIPRPSC